MRAIDKKLHDTIHQNMMDIPPEKIFSHRVDVFKQIEKELGVSISGSVLDVGCGNGYASIWLAMNRNVNTAYAMEESEAAIKELLPRNINYHGVNDIVKPFKGSFDDIPLESSIDFVIAFGAIHHSPCLYSTMKSISKSLKDGGYLIAQEPVMPNMTSNKDYIDKYNVIEERFGMKIRNGDRDDHFFREAEYIVAASYSGLDLIYYADYNNMPSTNLLEKLRNIIIKIKRIGMSGIASKIRNKLSVKLGLVSKRCDSFPNPMMEHTKNVVPKIFVFKKSNVEYIPHLWRSLK